MRVRWLSALLVGLLTLPLVAAAPVAEPPVGLEDLLDTRRSVNGQIGARQVVVDADGFEPSPRLRRPSELIREALSAREGLPLARTARTFVAERWDLPGLSPDEPSGEASEDEEELEQDWEWQPGSAAYVMGAGDLTGDDADDLLVAVQTVELDDEGQPLVQVDLEARRGATGELLWRSEDAGADAFAWPVGDLTGDGASDVLSFTYTVTAFEYEETCDDGGCGFSFAGDYERTLRLRNGPTGQVVWEDVGTAWERYEERWHDGGYDFRYELGGLLLPVLIDDRDGDGGLDLAETMVERFAVQASAEWTQLYVASVEEWRASQRATTHDGVRAGSSGALQRFAAVADSPEVGLLTAAGDLTGDGTSDLARDRFRLADHEARCVWLAPVGSYCDDDVTVETSVDAIDGVSLERLWSSGYDGYADVWPLAADATGDGTDDVTVTVEDDDGAQQLLLAGDDGAEVWRRETADPWDWLVPIGDLTDRGATDLVNLSFEEVEPELPGGRSRFEIVLTRVHGASGAELFTTRRGPTDHADGLFMWIGVSPDLDGDDVNDLNTGYVAYDRTSDGEWEFVGSEDALESGRDGTVGVRISDDPDRYLWPVRDLGGDDLADVYDLRLADDGSSVTALQVPGWQVEPLWTVDIDAWWGMPWPVGELDDRAGFDLVEVREVERGERTGYRLSVSNGRSLTELWTVEG